MKNDLEKQLHEQYVINNNSKLGSLVTFLTALVGIFACYGYVFTFSGYVPRPVQEDYAPGLLGFVGAGFKYKCFHIDLFLLTAGATFFIISVLHNISLYLGVDQRKEQFLIFAIRLKAYTNNKTEEEKDEYRKTFPKQHCPMNKSGVYNIAQGLHGKFCIIFIIMYIIILIMTLFKVLYYYHQYDPNFNDVNQAAVIIASIALFGSFSYMRESYHKAKKEYENRVKEYKECFQNQCPYSNNGCSCPR